MDTADDQTKPQIIEHANKAVDFTLFDAKWVPSSARFVALGSRPRGTGALIVYQLSQGELKEVSKCEKPSAFKCGTFGASSLQERHLATGSFDGQVQTWDLERTEVPIYSAKGHSEIINCIDGCGGLGIGHGSPEIVTGSRDGCVRVWDTRQKDKPVADMAPQDGQQKRDCWCVAFGNSFNNDERHVTAGYDNGDVKMFDLRKMELAWETNVKNGVCGLEYDRKDINANKLVVTTLESRFHVFDLRTYHKTKGYADLVEKAHSSTIWCASHLPQHRDVFMTCGGTGSLNLWKYQYPNKRAVKGKDDELEGVPGTVDLLQKVAMSTQPISSFDWSPDKQGLCVTTSFDQMIRVIIVTRLNLV